RRQVLVMKSTVPVGTGEKVRAALEARGLTNIGYASNPEFLAEGHAVRDFLDPDRIVIGAFAEEDAAAVEALYGGIEAPVVGAEVRTWDPVARPGELMKGAVLCDTVLEAVTGADAAVIVTEWDALRGLASAEVRDAMARPLIIDGRNLLDPEQTRRAGFVYEGIGRRSVAVESPGETPEPSERVSG